MSLFNELKRRNVFRVGIAYVVIAWLLAQVADLALENFGSPDWVIKTLLFMLALGFPLALFFAWAFELTPEGIKKEKEVDRTQSITQNTGRKLDFIIIGILVVALGYFAFDKFIATPGEETELVIATEPATSTTLEADDAAAEPDRSIAVLPFADMSPEHDQEYFSDGISEEILNSLARVKELKVAGRTSSFSFKDKNEDLRTIGSALGVAHILEGSVRKSGNTLRITAQLIKVDDGFHLWSDTYDRELTDVFAIQDEIAGAILEQMKLHLIGDAESPKFTSARADLEAYNLYLLAKQNIYTRNEESLELAARLLDQAIEIDPSYAPAYAQSAITTLLLSDETYGTIPELDAENRAKLLLDKAVELDPELAEGYAGFGLYYLSQYGQEQAGIEVLRKALAINPGLVNASNWLQQMLSSVGETAAARDILEGILERDPLYRPAIGNAGLLYFIFGQFDKKLALVERTKLYLPGDKRVLGEEGTMEMNRGNLALAARLLEASWQVERNDQASAGRLGFALSTLGQWERMVEVANPGQSIGALLQLGRSEEAGIEAQAWFDKSGDVGPLLRFLTHRHEYQRLIAFVEDRWSDIDEFDASYPERFGLGSIALCDIAYAYKQLGQSDKLNVVLDRIRQSHEQQLSQGANNWVLSTRLAYQAMLEQNDELALDFLEQAGQQGMYSPTRLSKDFPIFAALDGHQRLESLQSAMLEHINTERAKLELEPLAADSYL